MKKHSRRMAALVLAVTAGVAVFGACGEPRKADQPLEITVTPEVAAPGAAAAADRHDPVGVGTSFVVEPPMARYVAELDPREQREQVRDWAVLATMTRLGVTPEEAAAAMYELPPARLPYLDELYAFEYGRGRRVYLGSRVLLFRDGDDPDLQATIGRLADRVREESGDVPAKVEVYVVHDQRDEGTIRIERAPDVTGQVLFSPAYGYVEGQADSAAELAAWLGQADDLSFAQLRDGHLVVGGRRFAKTRTANLTVEDVAALYQAHEQLGASQAAARKKLRTLPYEAQLLAARIPQLLKAGKLDEVNEAERELAVQAWPPSDEEWERIKAAVLASALPVRGPGFSLDPVWLPDPAKPAQPLMLTRMRAFVADPCGELDAIVKRAAALERAEPDPTRRTSQTRRALDLRAFLIAVTSEVDKTIACRALDFALELDKTIAAIAAAAAAAAAEWEMALAHYHQLTAQLAAVAPRDRRGLPAALTRSALKYYEAETQAQCARYEGTRGTEVGMTMFYTDLLAKLWMLTDYGLSAPTLEVPGFVAEPRLDLSRELEESIKMNRGTRIWFGPRSSGVSRVGGAGTSILFEHAFARIFAAGTDLTQPGIETGPNESSRRAIGWWDRHYDDVADHEQEFHKLNQIMKWSLVTGALSDSETALYLRAVLVPRDRGLDHWHRANRARLRFSGSLPALSELGKECFPIFESYPFETGGEMRYMSGGVGAASRASFSRISVVNPAKPLGARKPPAPNLVGDKTGTAIRPVPRQDGKQVVFDHAAGIPTRDAKRDVALGTPTVTFRAGAQPGALEIHAGAPSRPIGVVTAERTGPNVRMRWGDGAAEEARHGAVSPARSLPEADRLARAGHVVSAASAYEATAANASPRTALGRARDVVILAARRRPAPVLSALEELKARGERLPPDVQEMLVGAIKSIATLAAVSHIKHALAREQPLDNSLGRLVVDRGQIIWTRDVKAMDASSMKPPPATDLSERHVYIDSRLRIGQEGLLPDIGGPAARWQHRPDVHMAVLRQQPMGPLPDVINEKSTGAKFDHIAPSDAASQGHLLPAIIIRSGANHRCDDSKRTLQTTDDCAR